MNLSQLPAQHFILFQHNTVQLHSPDHSILHFSTKNVDKKLIYVSAKGLKNVLALQQIHKIEEVKNKFCKCIDKINRYGKDHKYFIFDQQQKNFVQDLNKNGSTQETFKPNFTLSYKITQFRWSNLEVQQSKIGYLVKSDCGYAEVVLRKDLFILQVKYAQLIQIKKGYASRKPNMTKLLLQKYNYEYHQFPNFPVQNEKPEYIYKWQIKVFPILDVPKAWQHPLGEIWSSLIYHRVIPHQFKYVDYQIDMQKTTPMPEVIDLNDWNQKQQSRQVENLDNNFVPDLQYQIPILGKINHLKHCLFFECGVMQAWFGKDWNLMFDNVGFWEFNHLIEYRKMNRPQKQAEFHPQAIPYTIRFKNQAQRSILKQLKLFICYNQQNKKLDEFKLHQRPQRQSKFDNRNTLVNQQIVADIGEFKAYSNGVVIVNFVDRYLVTLNSKRMEVKIIKNNGETCFVDLSKNEGINYNDNKAYITYAVDFQQRTFYPEQWVHKQQLSDSISEAIKDTEVFTKVGQTYLKL